MPPNHGGNRARCGSHFATSMDHVTNLHSDTRIPIPDLPHPAPPPSVPQFPQFEFPNGNPYPNRKLFAEIRPQEAAPRDSLRSPKHPPPKSLPPAWPHPTGNPAEFTDFCRFFVYLEALRDEVLVIHAGHSPTPASTRALRTHHLEPRARLMPDR